jgi:DHA3 family macrolide efflux protein-like MFS transporter
VLQKGQYKELLQLPAFRNLFWGQTISQLGDALYYLVFLFMIEKITGDPRMVGVAGVAQTLPFLLLSPYAGVLADRQDRRKIMLTADILSTITLLVFALILWLNPSPPAWTIVATGALLSTINVFFAPAKGAAIPQIVPEEKLMSANALSMAVQNLMPMIGIGLSGTVLGILYAISQTGFFLAAILLNALSFLVSALYIRLLPTLKPQKEVSASESQAQDSLADLRNGLRYIYKNPVLHTMVWLNMLVNLAIAPFMLVYVQVNSAWFGGGTAHWHCVNSRFLLG